MHGRCKVSPLTTREVGAPRVGYSRYGDDDYAAPKIHIRTHTHNGENYYSVPDIAWAVYYGKNTVASLGRRSCSCKYFDYMCLDKVTSTRSLCKEPYVLRMVRIPSTRLC